MSPRCWYLLITFLLRIDHIFLALHTFSNLGLFPGGFECSFVDSGFTYIPQKSADVFILVLVGN